MHLQHQLSAVKCGPVAAVNPTCGGVGQYQSAAVFLTPRNTQSFKKKHGEKIESAALCKFLINAEIISR